jgi:type I restriction enzyme S subunit
MKSEWKDIPLYELATWKNGLAFRNINFSDVGRPIIKIAELKNGITGQTKFTDDIFDDAVALTIGDMTFSWSGNPETSIDVFWYDLPDGWLNQHIFKVTEKDINRSFLFYILKYCKPIFKSIAANKQTTGLGHVTIKDLKELIVSIPARKEQEAIADILSSLDVKISINNKINDYLEQTARAIFKSYFVDFEPFGGEMPSNWREVSLGEVIEIKHGYAFKGEYFSDKPTDYLLVTPGNFAIGGGFQEKPKYYNGPIHKEYILKKDDLIVTMTDLSKQSDTLGYSALVPEDNRYLHNQRIGLVTINNNLPLKECIYWLMRTRAYQLFIANHASGSTVKHTSPKTILSYRFNLPDSQTLEATAMNLRAINQLIGLSNAESSCLAELRDTVLPRLMSGELSVTGL